MPTYSIKELNDIAKRIRKHILKMTLYSKSSHIGSALSIVEILVVLYYYMLNIDQNDPKNKERNKFILSKAHGSAALYATLAEKGIIPFDYLEKYYVDGGILPGHLDSSVHGIEYSTGSLGHGFPVAIGMAIANLRSSNSGRIFVIIGDGECNEGSVWEGIMLASHLKLTNLTAILDYNKIQSFGRTNDVINQEPIIERWKSFGWDVFEVDGHNFTDLINAFNQPNSKPKVIIAHTVKGKGISFMEDKLEWHYKSPNQEQYDLAIRELDDKN